MVIVIRKENERGQKMKNKFISAFAAIAMVAVSLTPVSAEWHPSQAQGGVSVPEGSSEVEDTNGNKITVTTSSSVAESGVPAILISPVSAPVDPLTTTIYNKALKVSGKNTDAFLSEFGSLQTDVQSKLKEIAGNTAKSEDLEMLSMFDVTANELAKQSIGDGSVNVTASVPGVKASGKYVVVHFTSESTAEVLQSSWADGTVTFTMGSSFSPVMVLSYNEGSAKKDNSGKVADTSDNGNTLLYAGVMATALVAAGIVFFKTRKKAGQDSTSLS